MTTPKMTKIVKIYYKLFPKYCREN